MQQVPSNMLPTTNNNQSIQAGPFRTLIEDDAPHHLPHAAKKMARHAPSAAILTGEAGANLTLSRLQSWGIATQPAMTGVAYDLIADVPGFDMIRLQVKTKSKPGGQTCSFTMSRGQYYSPAGVFKYASDDYDIAAFVCLKNNSVFFCAAPIHRICVRSAWLYTPDVDRETFKIALQTIRRRRQLDAISWLSSMSSDEPEPAVKSPVSQDTFNF